jgi:hypothetical protein
MVSGNSFTQDGCSDRHFDDILANPPTALIEGVRRTDQGGGGDEGLRRPVRRGFTAPQRRLVPVPAAHVEQDEAVGDRPETSWTDGGSHIAMGESPGVV